MKVQIANTAAVSKPVTIQITFETKEELGMFVDIVRFNESIPALVTRNSNHGTKTPEYELCHDILTALHHVSVSAFVNYDKIN